MGDMSLTSLYHTGPVTALCCYGNLILAGIGGALWIYRVTDQTCLKLTTVLPSSVIHGFRLGPDSRPVSIQLCVFGGKCLRIATVSITTGEVTLDTDVYQQVDWIWDVTWLQGVGCLALALGHNVITILEQQTGRPVRTVHCREKCILYTAKFLTNDMESLILAAGTVFNQVVLWSCSGSVLHRLSGHQGVIFSVAYDSHTQKICSVSDDRSIRVWQLKFNSGSDKLSLFDWETLESSLQCVLYGHSARVWDVQLLSVVLVSVGEDSTCCVWDYDGQILNKFKGHKGKSIWSLAVAEDESYVVTGGGDNSIRVWYLQQQDTGSIDSGLALHTQLDEGDFPRVVKLLDFNTVLIMTNEGVLWQHEILTGSWSQLMADRNFRSYTVMASSPSGTEIGVGNIHGTVRIICAAGGAGLEKTWPMHYEELYSGKVLSLSWLSDGRLLTSGPDGVVNLLEVSYSSGFIILKKVVSFTLPPSRQCWVAAATVSPDWSSVLCGDRSGSVYVYEIQTGSQTAELVQRFVKIHSKAGVTDICFHDNEVYTAGRDGQYRVFSWGVESRRLSLLNSHRVFKGLEWIERLSFTEEGDIWIQGFHSNQFILWSVGQNQKLVQISCGGGHRAWDFQISRHGNHARLVYLKSREVVQQLAELNSCQQILKAGLHGRELCDVKHLYSYTTATGEDVDVLLTCSEDTNICLSALQYKPGRAPELSILQTLHGHISSVRHLAVCHSTHPTHHTPCMLVFSGGGRAQVKVWRIQLASEQGLSSSPSLVDGSCIEQDNRGASELEKDVLGTNQAVCDIRKNSGHCDTNNIGSVRGSSEQTNDGRSCRVESVGGIQLGLQDGRHRRKKWTTTDTYSDPETRFLALTVFPVNKMRQDGHQGLYFLSAACSDGCVRFYGYNEDSREITLLGSSAFHDHCVLKVSHVLHHWGQTIHAIVLTAATDGRVAFWDVTAMVQKYVKDSTHRVSDCESNMERPEKKQDMESSDCDNITGKIKATVASDCGDVTSGNKATAGVEGRLVQCDNIETSSNEQKTTLVNSSQDSSRPERLSDPSHPDSGQTLMKEGDERPESKPELHPVFTLSCHQSGINSLHAIQHSGNRYMVVTGGDDNALHITLVSIETVSMATSPDMPQCQVKVVAKGDYPSAHSAQITGAWCLSSDRVLTASIDQRVCVWAVNHTDAGTLQVRQISSRLSSVADIANIDVWMHRNTTRVAVCGEGLELFTLQTTQQDGYC